MIRRVPEQVEGLQSFAAAAARSAGLSAARVRSLFDDGSQWIDFPGPFKALPISFAEVLARGFDASKVRGQIVVIGATDSATAGRPQRRRLARLAALRARTRGRRDLDADDGSAAALAVDARSSGSSSRSRR